MRPVTDRFFLIEMELEKNVRMHEFSTVLKHHSRRSKNSFFFYGQNMSSIEKNMSQKGFCYYKYCEIKHNDRNKVKSNIEIYFVF